MEFFAWGVNHPGVADKRSAIIREHWDFIDRYKDRLIARGPVLDPGDPSRVTGSIHIAELDDWREARRFVHEEPFHQAGLFEHVLIRRFELELGRTQFEFESAGGLPRFFIYCPAAPGNEAGRERAAGEYGAYCAGFDANFLCRGALLDDRGGWAGSIYLMEMADTDAVDGFLEGEPYREAALYGGVEVHRWTPGGPENLNRQGELA